jgi:hypothetical protein
VTTQPVCTRGVLHKGGHLPPFPSRPSQTRPTPEITNPGLPQLYGYMLANRRKVLGGGSNAPKAKAA